MKLAAILPVAVLAATLCQAAPLTAPTAVLASPEASAATIVTLPAGTDLAHAAGVKAPAGWAAVTLPGPHTVFVDDKDLLKNFDVKPGAAYRSAPAADATVLATATAADTVEITGLSGRWLQLNLKRDLTGYIRTSAATPAQAPAATPAPVVVTTPAAPAVGRAVEPGGSALPRMFQGTLVSSRSPFRPRRPHDYQLNDSRGVRYAYLDLTKLLLTEQIDSYLGRTVEIYGTAGNLPDSKDIVIKVETLKLP
ncbi:MAG: hypothetical protein ABII82_17570 [Verrucomicrobiota bacterium]